ncbi:NAD(P)H-hydrate epimerase [Accumulibacter sp.]|uniref:NAD(P)H-hydrate epimerase n=1 Tax=Accumulibacter sp. TaxID=2053492 RepID=UPI0033903988
MKTALRSEALYRAAELRSIESAAADQPLMQRAGLAAADLATALCRVQGAPLLIFAGPGNNGGDAFVAARHLRERRFAVHVVFAGEGVACRRMLPPRTSVSSTMAAACSRAYLRASAGR